MEAVEAEESGVRRRELARGKPRNRMRLLGAPYRGGNALFWGNDLYTPTGNRIGRVDLAQGLTSTLPFQNLKSIERTAISPDGSLLVTIDVDGKALLINAKQRALLHHFSFKGPVSVATFSQDGQYLAVGIGKLVQIWHTPSTNKEVAPMHLHRTYGQSHADVTTIAWTPDSKWLAVGSKDLAVRIFSIDPIEGYVVPTLTGHREATVGVFFAGRCDPHAAKYAALGSEAHMYTVSRDGALFEWEYEATPAAGDAGGAAEAGAEEGSRAASGAGSIGCWFQGGRWRLRNKRFFMQPAAKLTAVDFHRATGLVVAGFSNGVFDLYRMPGFERVHALSISRERITTASFNATGEWIALGCAKLGQLLVWEWRSESYVLKQQGHYYDVTTLAYSPDGTYLATGADDNKVKVWNSHLGTCFVTFSDHTQPVTAVHFLPPSGQALVSASLDGTVRAYDLVRYRNFRTFTSPTPTQLSCLAVDPSGELVCAGSQDTFQIFVWSIRTSRLLDVLAAHQGPVSALAFSPARPLLASASWDKTVRTWDLYGGKGVMEVLQHNHDVLALAFRPDGKLLASATLDGTITLWDPIEGEIKGTIEGRRDIARGRLQSDRRAAGNLASGNCFTSLAFSADGTFLLAGGQSKYVCMYDVEDRVLLARFQISKNRSLDGVLDTLNSRNMTDAGPLDLIDDSDDEDEDGLEANAAGGPASTTGLPGTGKAKKPTVRTRAVALSPTGRAWSAATTEGVLVYGLDQGAVFDPTDLEEDITPQAVAKQLIAGSYLRAILIAARLGDPALLEQCLMTTPPGDVQSVSQGLPVQVVPKVLSQVAEILPRSPHVEFLLRWVQHLGVSHGEELRNMAPNELMPALRALQRSVVPMHEDLQSVAEGNVYTLDFLASQKQERAAEEQMA